MNLIDPIGEHMTFKQTAAPTGQTDKYRTDRTIIIGTRGSKLALWQAEHIKGRLADIGVSSELKIIKTQGDIVQHLRLDKLEGKGFFTKELEEELLRGSIDLAVHSHKDLPTQNPPGLVIAAVSEREDPSELLIIRKERVDHGQRLSVKQGALVGTSSNRRKAQLLALRPDLQFGDLRGNVITRVEKLRKEDYDAIVLAKAGISRIGLDLDGFYVVEIPPYEVIPAPAQGVLALQIRESDEELHEILGRIHDADTAEEIAVERRVLALFEAGCHAPLGCYCRRNEQGGFEVWTSKADRSDEFPDRLYLSAPTTEGLAEQIAAQYSNSRKQPAQVFISREISSTSYFRRAMGKHGIQVDDRSLIQTVSRPLQLGAADFENVDWVFFTSRNSVIHFFEQAPALPEALRFAVIGRGSEEQLRQYGRVPSFNGADAGIDMEKIAAAFAHIAEGATVLIPRAVDTLGTMRRALTAGTKVIDVPIYQTVLNESVSASDADVLIFTSPSNIRAYFSNNTLRAGQQVICIGYASGKELESLGYAYTLPATPDEIGLAEAVFGLNV